MADTAPDTKAGATDTMNAQQVADFLHVHVNTVRKLYREDRLPYVRIGRAIRFRRVDVEAWLSQKVTAESV